MRISKMADRPVYKWLLPVAYLGPGRAIAFPPSRPHHNSRKHSLPCEP